jgi:hypothetical protein
VAHLVVIVAERSGLGGMHWTRGPEESGCLEHCCAQLGGFERQTHGGEVVDHVGFVDGGTSRSDGEVGVDVGVDVWCCVVLVGSDGRS